MKKFKIALITAAVSIAALGFAACTTTPPEPDKFSVAFDSAWGLFETQTVVDGDSAQKPADPVRVGYTFDGWYLNGVLYTFTEPVTSNITLVARFSSILGGTGTETDPFTIDNAAELALFKGYIDANEVEFVSAVYVQTANITSTLTAPVSAFGGVYDGGGYTIETSVPLFNKLTGTVKNLGIEGAITYATDVGMLANISENANIIRITTSGSVESQSGTAGGIVGALNSGRMEYCVSSAEVKGVGAGGLAGKSSGVIINGLASGDVTASEIAGGIVAEISAGALVQNVGFDGTVTGDVVGGVVGYKSADSAVYRGFVYGEAKVNGITAGGIVGDVQSDLTKHKDIADCYVVNGVAVNGTTVNTYIGQSAVNDLNKLTLPSAVWTVTDGVPELRSTLTAFPATVGVDVNGMVTSALYGSHETRELFTNDDAHFSKLIELDTDVQLKTVTSTHLLFNGKAFRAGNAALSLGIFGAKMNAGGDAYKDLTYINTFAHTEKLLYTPDFDYPSTAYDIEYDAPVSVYTDGQKYYAFVVFKEYIGNNLYMAFMRSYVLTDGNAWTLDKEWDPETEFAGGAYKYTVKPLLGSAITYMFIIDGNYTANANGGYYLTRFVKRVEGDNGAYTESREVISMGQTVMYLGDNETNAPVTAFYYYVEQETYINFFYRDKNGKLVSSEGIELEDATNDFLVGTWFDGTNKYNFNTENKTVAITKGGDVSTVPYTVDNGKVKFTVSAKTYELTLTPSELGSYMLKNSGDGEALVMATYISGALDGVWLTEDGDKITVTSDPNAYVTFNDSAATEIYETVYNGRQAIMFTVGNKEYYVVPDVDGVAVRVIGNGKTVYAYDKEMIIKDFVGEFVSVVNGLKYELTTTEELEFTLKIGGGSNIPGKVVPVRTGFGKYALTFTMNSTPYTVERVNDVVIVKSGSEVITFTDAEVFARFVAEYTNGTEMLEITENGKFVRYARGSEKGEYINLTAGYRQERYEYGLEHRGFVLYYTSGDDTMFFYADVDAANIQLYRAWVNSVGNDTASRITNFVPDSELTPIYGSYTRTFNNKPDTLTFGTDGTLKRTYTDAQGTTHTNELITWYPLMNYNYNTQTSRIGAWTVESVGIKFESSIEFTETGLIWGMVGTYLSANEVTKAFIAYRDPIYIAEDNTQFTITGDNKVKLIYLNHNSNGYSTQERTFIIETMSLTEDDTVVVNLYEGFGSTGNSDVVILFKKAENKFIATVTIDDNPAVSFVGQTKIDYHDLLGSYVYDGTVYTFSESGSGLFATIALTWGSNSFRYNSNNGIAVMSDGSQALRLTSGNNNRYIWKVGKHLMISASLDVSEAIEAIDSYTANLPSIDAIKDLLDGETFTASDNTKVTFVVYSGFGSVLSMEIGDDEFDYEDGELVEDVYILHFEDYFGNSRYVKVFVNEYYFVTKLLVGETVATATKEYLPAYIPPTVEELIEIIKDKQFKAGDGSVVWFGMIADYWDDLQFSIMIGEDSYEYSSGTFNNNEYTLVFDGGYFADDIVAVITYTKNGVEKITIGGKEYLPMDFPTVDEITQMLKDTRYKAADGTSVSFSIISGIFGDNFVIETSSGTCYYDNKGSGSNGVYILVFEPSFGSDVIVTITYSFKNGVEKITINEKDYFVVTELTVDDVLVLLTKSVFKASDNEALYFNKYSDGYYVQIGTSDWTEYKYDSSRFEGILQDNICSLIFCLVESGSEPSVIQKNFTIMLNDDGTIQKVTLDGKDYLP